MKKGGGIFNYINLLLVMVFFWWKCIVGIFSYQFNLCQNQQSRTYCTSFIHGCRYCCNWQMCGQCIGISSLDTWSKCFQFSWSIKCIQLVSLICEVLSLSSIVLWNKCIQLVPLFYEVHLVSSLDTHSALVSSLDSWCTFN